MIRRQLKRDGLGSIRLLDDGGRLRIERDTRLALFGARWLARRLAAREARVLATLDGIAGVPRLVAFDGRVLERTYVPGAPLYESPPTAQYFVNALRLLRALHRRGIAHNDLAKEANWLRAGNDAPGIVDFQVAMLSTHRGRWFRALAYEDLRHWLKHKRTYHPDRLTKRQRELLAKSTWPSTLWRRLVKPVYRAFTRHVLGWRDRVGPVERQI
jgi:hypothetical protein